MSDTSPSAPSASAPAGDGAAIDPRLANEIVTCLPYLRRYARALTGNQTSGDRCAAATMEAILADRSLLDSALGAKVSLFRAFQSVWSSSGSKLGDTANAAALAGAEARAQARMANLTPRSREALLLRVIEEFRSEEVAQIMRITAPEADALVQAAMREMEAEVPGKVMIIEDEPLIAMDIRNIVQDMGHTVTGIAPTRREAIRLGEGLRPDLILADIQLADNSSGIDAVNDLLATLGDVPVVFITAFPDRLLTGERPEPAFLITKPFTQEQVRSAVSQAIFFSSTETMAATD